MLSFEEYRSFDGVGLAELVRGKNITPLELVDVAINRLENVNPKINAVITKMYDYARKRAVDTLSDGFLNSPFCGVPFLLKDILQSFAGFRLTMGSRSMKDYVPSVDSELVKRYNNAGVIILGKTNVPELGLMGITEPELHGPTRNPWGVEYSSGGSSGGSASAVASGIVPIAHGNDGGGSIRIPSSACGLFGFKPSRGRNPTGPEYGEVWQGAVVDHILTRSVRDSAAMLDATCGADPGAAYVIGSPAVSYTDELQRNPGKLKIAFSTKSPVGTPVHAEYIDAVHKTASLLESMGHYVEEIEPEIDGEEMAKSYLTMYFGEVNVSIKEIAEKRGKRVKWSELELLTKVLYEMGRVYTAGDFVLAKRFWGKASRSMGEFHKKYDLYLTPTVATPPPKIGELLPGKTESLLLSLFYMLKLGKIIKHTTIAEKMAKESYAKMPFTQLANLTGQPAMSVPLFQDKSGLPLGVQFMAKNCDEGTLFSLASQLEKANPWFNRMPQIS